MFINSFIIMLSDFFILNYFELFRFLIFNEVIISLKLFEGL